MSARRDDGLAGRVALVTGGSGGIGSAVVAALLDAGARVVSFDRPGTRAPDRAVAFEGDVADPIDVARAMDRARSIGGLQLLVHCAGITRDGVLWKQSDGAWREVIDVNLGSAFYLLRAATPLLRESDGNRAIVLISSINGERGKFGQANYSASKAGLIGLARTAARELGAFGVRVNCVAPGLVETPMAAALSPDARQRALAETVLGRLGSPDDVADVVLFLCSHAARHVTGQNLRVDGGQLIA